tara:strand:- start:122 stop:388 length:267 start_codon:yes stop_codon:yes gene_type:complete
MKVEMISDGQEFLRVLVPEEGDTNQSCENCGKECYDHELLFKEDREWCMNCNDLYQGRDKWSDERMGKWVLELMTKGYAACVIRRLDE